MANGIRIVCCTYVKLLSGYDVRHWLRGEEQNGRVPCLRIVRAASFTLYRPRRLRLPPPASPFASASFPLSAPASRPESQLLARPKYGPSNLHNQMSPWLLSDLLGLSRKCLVPILGK